MNAYRTLKGLTVILILTVAGGTLSIAPAHGATFQWVNAQGGAWQESGNWSLPGHPQYSWDAAVFDLDTAYEVNATESSQIQAIGAMSVRTGSVTLSTHDGLTAAVEVGAYGVPATLVVRAGMITTTGIHGIGQHGTLVLEPGAKLSSQSWVGLGFSIVEGGVLRGDGGSLENRSLQCAGTISPGIEPGSIGRLLIGQDTSAGYSQTATGRLEIDIAGLMPGDSHDQLSVANATGAVVLDGTLAISLVDDYVPAEGERFEVLVAPAITGSFAATEVSGPDGVEFEVVYEPSVVAVVAHHVTSPAPLMLDVLPHGCRRSLALLHHAIAHAALIGTAGVDLAAIDPASLRLEGVAPYRTGYKDITSPPTSDDCACEPSKSDGVEDLYMRFSVLRLLRAVRSRLDGKELVLTLTGNYRDGTSFEVEDCVVLRYRPGEGSGNEVANGESERNPWPRRKKRPSIFPRSQPTERTQQITFVLDDMSEVRIGVYDVRGRKIADVLETTESAGEHTIAWDASHVPNGVYFYRLETGSDMSTAKVLLVR